MSQFGNLYLKSKSHLSAWRHNLENGIWNQRSNFICDITIWKLASKLKKQPSERRHDLEKLYLKPKKQLFSWRHDLENVIWNQKLNNLQSDITIGKWNLKEKAFCVTSQLEILYFKPL